MVMLFSVVLVTGVRRNWPVALLNQKSYFPAAVVMVVFEP